MYRTYISWIRVLTSVVYHIVLPVFSQQYSIKVNGKVEMGDQVSSILQVLYNTFLNGEKTPFRINNKDFVRESESIKDADAPFIEEIMSKNEITHLYGKHKKDKHKKNNIQV